MDGDCIPGAAAACCDDYRSQHSTPHAAVEYEKTYQAGYYAALWRKIEQPLVAAILQAIGSSNKTCLDFACGTGRIANVAAAYFGQVAGVDISADMLARARCPDNVRLHQIDITRQALDLTFDAVTAFRFFLNAEPSLRREALVAIHRHLNEDGRLVCNIQMNATSPMGIASRIANQLPWSTQRNTMSVGELSHLLQSAGFAVEQVVAYGYLPRPGSLLPHLCEVCVGPADRFANALRVPARFAQQFIVVARRL